MERENNKPIRILIVDGKLISGGVEAFLMNIYRHIDREKIQFDFLVHYQEEFFYDAEVERLGGRIYRLSFRNDNNVGKYIRDLNKFFHEHAEYKIVWGHMDGLASIYLKVAKECGVPITIAHSHITSSEKSIKGLIKRILRTNLEKCTDYRFACSTEAGQYLYGKSSFQLVHNAIDTKKFVFNDSIRNKIRKQYGWEDCVVVGHVGRFFPQKNHEFLVNIFKEISNTASNYRLCLCGDGEDRPMIERRVADYGLSDKVVFTGNISNINDYYQAFDIFLLPSLYEGLPVSGIEAQTSGLRCVFSDSITREAAIVDRNVDFFSINNDPKSWAEEVIRFSEYKREDVSSEIIDAGYDINHLAAQLQYFFYELWYKI